MFKNYKQMPFSEIYKEKVNGKFVGKMYNVTFELETGICRKSYSICVKQKNKKLAIVEMLEHYTGKKALRFYRRHEDKRFTRWFRENTKLYTFSGEVYNRTLYDDPEKIFETLDKFIEFVLTLE